MRGFFVCLLYCLRLLVTVPSSLFTVPGLLSSQMFCPQCGTESGSGLQYCRSCGANLKVIGKALTLSEAIARSDRGPLPKLKQMVRSLKVEHVGEEVSRALERMNQEIVSLPLMKPAKPWGLRQKKTPEERREKLLVKGTVSLFSGIGLMIFLYYFASVLVLKLPPDIVREVPFEIDPLVHVLWLIGLIPVLAGLGRLLAGAFIRPTARSGTESTLVNQSSPGAVPIRDPIAAHQQPSSVTEHTTNLLEPPQ